MLLINEISLLALAGASGLVGGWWLRSRGDKQRALSEGAPAHEVLQRMHDVADNVVLNVGAHAHLMQEISDELSGTISPEAQAVAAAVERLIEANEQMQRELSLAEKKLQEQSRRIESHLAEARTDALTGLANRRALDDELFRRSAEAKRHDRAVTLVLIDLDFFKQLNDTWGHQVGDQVLRCLAGVLRQSVRDMDLPARYGGEEFAAVLPGTPVEQALVCAERIRAAIEQTQFVGDGREVPVTASVGVAERAAGEGVEAWVRRTDEALYAAKRVGRNRVAWHDGQVVHQLPVGDDHYVPQPASGSPAAEAEGPRGDSPAHGENDELGGGATTDDQPEAGTPISRRTEFCHDIQRRIAAWRRDGRPWSLLMLEVDDFSILCNQPGPELIRGLQRTMPVFFQATLREMDHVARLSDHLFAVLLPEADLPQGGIVGERLRRDALEIRLPLAHGEQGFTVSVGLTTVQAEDTWHSMLERADAALRAAIAHGRNRSYLHDGQQCLPVGIGQQAGP